MNVEKNRSIENHEPYKVSDRRVLRSEAKVIYALTKKQPQKLNDLCSNSGISQSTFYRIRRLLKNERIVKEVERGYALWNYVEPTSLWGSLQGSLGQVGAKSVETIIAKASYVGRDQETGWRDYDYKTSVPIEGIMVLKRANKLVAIARSFGIHMKDEHGCVFLTPDSIGWPDHLWWRDNLYEVKDAERRDDGYNFSFNIAYLNELIRDRVQEETADAHSILVHGARSQTRTFLTTHLTDANIVKDSGSTQAAYCVIYTDPDYPIEKEFHASISPVDGIYAIGRTETLQLFDADQTVYGYDEHVPIFIYTVDKAEVSGVRLQWTMEAELRRVCEAYPIVSQQRGRLERRRETQKQIGSTILYFTEFVLNFRRSKVR